jgi:hypothetical protein
MSDAIQLYSAKDAGLDKINVGITIKLLRFSLVEYGFMYYFRGKHLTGVAYESDHIDCDSDPKFVNITRWETCYRFQIPNTENYKSLVSAIYDGDLEKVKGFSSIEDLDKNFLNNALVVAAERSFNDIAEYLINKGADVNYCFEGNSALNMAVLRLNYDLVKLLCDKGCTNLETYGMHDTMMDIFLEDLAKIWNYFHRDQKKQILIKNKEFQDIEKYLKEEGRSFLFSPEFKNGLREYYIAKVKPTAQYKFTPTSLVLSLLIYSFCFFIFTSSNYLVSLLPTFVSLPTLGIIGAAAVMGAFCLYTVFDYFVYIPLKNIYYNSIYEDAVKYCDENNIHYKTFRKDNKPAAASDFKNSPETDALGNISGSEIIPPNNGLVGG